MALCAVALQLQLWHSAQDLRPLWLLLAAGVIFAVAAALGLSRWYPGERRRDALPTPSRATLATQGATSWRGLAVGFWRRTAVWLALALACEALALSFFRAGGAFGSPGWAAHFVAAGLFLWGMWRWGPEHVSVLRGGWNRVDTALIGGICLLAFLVRTWQLSTVPAGIWFDEGERGLEAVRIASDPAYRPVFTGGFIQAPTAFSYLIVPFLQLLGRDPAAVRLPPAIFGTLDVAALYLLARILFERHTAIVAAVLLMGLSWQINFSRFALVTICSVALNALAMAFFVLGLRRRSTFAFAAAGVAAGAGIHFYYSSQIFPVVLALVVLHLLVTQRARFLREYMPGLVVAAVGYVLFAAPIVQFAIGNWDEFNRRASTVNVFQEVRSSGTWDPLIGSLKAHLLMFNAIGDANGRHNWTGRPQLDAFTGAMFVLGLGMAVSRVWRWEYALPLFWLPIMLASGVLSISWEAPQSNRTADVINPVILLAALPVSLLWRSGDAFLASFVQSRRGTDLVPRALLASATTVAPVLVVASMLGVTVVKNVHRYFNDEVNDTRTWLEFSAHITEAGRLANAEPPDRKIYVDQRYLGNPSMAFMLSRPGNLEVFDPSNHFPIPTESALVLVSNQYEGIMGQFEAAYPRAERKAVTPPQGGPPYLYAVNVSADDVRAVEGVVGKYGEGPEAVVRREPRLEFNWPAGAPKEPPFAAHLASVLSVATHGQYVFALEGPPDATLILNGEALIVGPGRASATLARGRHSLQVDAPLAGRERLRVLWQPPGATDLSQIPGSALHTPPVQVTGLVARLYPGRSTTGQPAIERVDPNIDLEVHAMPLGRPYTVEWRGALRAPVAGVYRIGTTSRDSSAVWINGAQIVDNRQPGALVDRAIELTAGWHDIRVEWHDESSFTQVKLYWQPPGQGLGIVPSEVLRPWPAERVALADLGPLGDALGVLPPARAAPGPAALPGVTQTKMMEVASRPGWLQEPRGLAAAPDGTVYVADLGKKAIVAIAPDGGTRTLAHPDFKEPADVAVAPDGSLLVLDAGASALWRMSPSGGSLERLVPREAMYGPRGIRVAADGRIAIADTGNNRVILLSPGEPTTAYVQNLKEPTSVDFLTDGNLVIADSGSNQIIVTTPSGARVGAWPMPPSVTAVGPHVTALPGGGWVATTPQAQGLLYLEPDAGQLESWSAEPPLRLPVGIAAAAGTVYVTDAEGRSVSRLALSREEREP